MWLLLAKILFVQGTTATDIKTWTAKTNFEEPRNWEDGKLPCSNDRIIFPRDASLITFLPTQLSFAEMVLPMNGELVLREGSDLLITGGSQKGSCQGQDVHFIVNTDYWTDPKNWNMSSPNAYPESSTPRKNLAVPHALQLPCASDKVVFPKDVSFKTRIDVNQISIGSIEINAIEYTHAEFQDLLSGRTGSLLFPGNPKIEILGSVCNDPSGCKCSTDVPQVMQKICPHVQCPPTKCSDAVKPTGHCCPVCVSYLEFEYDAGFQLGKLVDYYKTYLTKPNFKDVESFTFKTHTDVVQTVFVDGGKNKGAAAEIAKTFHQQLSEDMKGSNVYRLHSITIFASEKWNSGVPTSDFLGGQGMSSGGIATLILVILCLIGLAIAWYVYKRRQIPGFNFARFDLRSNKVELELGTTPHEDLDPEDSKVVSFPSIKTGEDTSIAKAFDNPIYDASAASGAKTMPEVKLESSEGFVENPMFMMFEDSPGENK